ncbi:MAG TPA: hypothetical protein VFI79_10000 [Gemmatimonadales bacterium]|nr:hypothetical protein [Gemmatimonadales bacterium]
MRVTLADPTLARQAGRFVWLELNFDRPANRQFFARHRVRFTPSLFVLDPADERALACHFGGMPAGELLEFLDQGARGYARAGGSAADSLLARGDALLGVGRVTDAASAYRAALAAASPDWRERETALSQLAWALTSAGEWRACASTAVAEAPRMARGQRFARVVYAGLACANRDSGDAALAARRTLAPLAAEALGRTDIRRDDRFLLYGVLMGSAQLRGDTLEVAGWGTRALDEIDRITPRSQDERTALDIARIEMVWDRRSAERVIPALAASERAMPGSDVAAVRLAQAELAAERYPDARAACARGLRRARGPIVRTWLCELEARAWLGMKQPAAARRALARARAAAQAIGTPENRESNLRTIARLMADVARRAG